jgi:hypothetical protein
LDGYADGATATGILGPLRQAYRGRTASSWGNCPKETVSLGLTLKRDEKREVECYGRSGKQIEVVPNDTTSTAFVADLEGAFSKETFSDDAIVVLVSSSMMVRAIRR